MTEMSSLGQKSVLGALLIFTLNMAGAWWLALGAADNVARPLVPDGETSAVARVLDSHGGASANSHTLLNRVVDAEIQIRTAQNGQTLSVVAMAGSFAMMSIGFALFVMGAEGAFQLEGSAPTGGNLVLKSTAPGVICFALATLVLLFALYKQIDLTTGSFQVFPDSEVMRARTHVGGAGALTGPREGRGGDQGPHQVWCAARAHHHQEVRRRAPGPASLEPPSRDREPRAAPRSSGVVGPTISSGCSAAW